MSIDATRMLRRFLGCWSRIEVDEDIETFLRKLVEDQKWKLVYGYWVGTSKRDVIDN